MRLRVATAAGLSTLVLLGGCVSAPDGPTVPAEPSHGKSWSQFQSEDAECQDFAYSRVEGRARQANNRALTSAIIGTALGAGLGAAIGGGNGAAIGAASGAVVGTSIGTRDSRYAQDTLQGRYNIAYAQCMYSHGNRVPGFGDEEPGPPRDYNRDDNRDYPPPPPPGY
jgi:hypothetical protein